MPERTFGRTVKYRRNKLGLSQAKLGELVGRSASSVRSWERDKSLPSDSSVITALSAVLGVEERMLFDKAGQPLPEVETSPTIEQALASLSPEAVAEQSVIDPVELAPAIELEGLAPAIDSEELAPAIELEELPPDVVPPIAPVPDPTPKPAFVAPPSPYRVTAAVPRVNEPSYMEDRSQRQLYRVRNLATIVVLVGLGIMLLWAFTESFDAVGSWWEDFFGNLRL